MGRVNHEDGYPIEPPIKPPPTRVEYRGFLCGFFGPRDQFELWRSLPWWRRALGLTAWDKANPRGWAYHVDEP